VTHLHEIPPQPLQFYATATYPCGYLPGRLARSQVATPSWKIDQATYSALTQQGFRRSGLFTYRPHCDDCNACQSLRVPVHSFKPSRSQRRAWKQHHGQLVVDAPPATFSPEHYALYLRYQRARHEGGGMDQDSEAQFEQFLLNSRVNTHIIEFREPHQAEQPGALRMVSVVDELSDGLSAVYTFYDPDPAFSLGTYNVLWQIQLARRMQLSYLYLGYWIEESPKMRYKAHFNPHERLINAAWLPAPVAGQMRLATGIESISA
jgi:leucyl-tRNA---protein transferase